MASLRVLTWQIVQSPEPIAHVSLLNKPSRALAALANTSQAPDSVLEFVRSSVSLMDITNAMQRDLQEVITCIYVL